MSNSFDPVLALSDGNFTARWNFPLAVGTLLSAPGGIGSAVNLTYSYLTSSASEPTFAPLTAGQKAATEMAIAAFEAVAGISLVEIANGGQISFGTNAQSGTAGYASYPAFAYSYSPIGPGQNQISSVTEISSSGDVWLSNTALWSPDAFLPNGDGLGALLHEVEIVTVRDSEIRPAFEFGDRSLYRRNDQDVIVRTNRAVCSADRI